MHISRKEARSTPVCEELTPDVLVVSSSSQMTIWTLLFFFNLLSFHDLLDCNIRRALLAQG